MKVGNRGRKIKKKKEWGLQILKVALSQCYTAEIVQESSSCHRFLSDFGEKENRLGETRVFSHFRMIQHLLILRCALDNVAYLPWNSSKVEYSTLLKVQHSSYILLRFYHA
jgi:hypothetical protein